MLAVEIFQEKRKELFDAEDLFNDFSGHLDLACLTDELLISLAQTADWPTNAVLLAVGGFGRQDLAPFSDIDILILTEDLPAETIEELNNCLSYPLWDLKLKCQPLIIDFKNLNKVMGEEFRTLTSLHSARFLFGNKVLFDRFKLFLQHYFVWPENVQLVQKMVERAKIERYRKHGNLVFQASPNLKEGPGGLRDWHSIGWLLASLGLEGPLGSPGHFFSAAMILKIKMAAKNILKIRWALHLSQQRAGEILAGPQSSEASVMMGYTQRRKFMKLYYRSAEIIQRSLRFVSEKIANKGQVAAGLSWVQKIFSGQIFSEADIDNFANDQATRSVELKRFWALLTHTGHSEENFEAFWVSVKKVLPSLGSAIYLAPLDPIHIYSVGAHSALSVFALKKLVRQMQERRSEELDDFDRKRLAEIENFDILYLAALVHDIGKLEEGPGHAPRGAQKAVELSRAVGLKPGEEKELELLIAQHILLADVATRRDLTNDDLIAEVAGLVKSPQNLSRLYLLTMADSLATAPAVWKNHRVSLIRELFIKVRAHFLTGKIEESFNLESLSQELKDLALEQEKRIPGSDLNEFLLFLPKEYFLHMRPRHILAHYELWKNYQVGKKMAWNFSGSGGSVRLISVLCKNRHGLLATLSGILAWAGFNILGAEVFSPGGQMALDIFTVSPPQHDEYGENRLWERLARGFELAEQQQAPVPHPGLAPVENFARKIIIDQGADQHFTVVEVHTKDRPGLLYDLTQALFELNLDVGLAKVDTIGPRAIDVFYVSDQKGLKINNDALLDKIKVSLSEAARRSNNSLEVCSV